MATALEEYANEQERSVVHYLWAKGFNVKDIHKEMFLVYGGKFLSGNEIHKWVEKSSQGRSKITDDIRPGTELAETTVKRLLCCGFRSTCTSVPMLVDDMSRNECFFTWFEYHMFYVLYPFVTYLLTLPQSRR
jgi:hypothetical protein